jgi:REP element-mobilizing transposase RayT
MDGLDPNRTIWHITFGTYGTRLHGGDRPTIDRKQNRLGQAFVDVDACRRKAARARMREAPVRLTRAQQRFIELRLPDVCERGGWRMRACAVGPDHVHVLCNADRGVHGRQIRALLKRWLTQALNEVWARSGRGSWWSEGGSTKAVKNVRYLENVQAYITRQRATW